MSFHFPTTTTTPPLHLLPSPQSRTNPSIFSSIILSKQKTSQPSKLQIKAQNNGSSEPIKNNIDATISNLAIHVGALLATVGVEPALAVTGMNNDEEDLIWTLIQLAISAFLYFIVVPPVIMNWMRVRWYRRGLGEMYLQFMFVFMFFPGLLLWAPFLNFRKFPRDPDMKYPWSRPENPDLIKSEYRKYPWATPEDYD